ncbi:AMP-binding enzyme domain-containing protein [Ditylenchus destructor]|uniref:AMP-binding enzyme domain-containing protein n=1 Tax=Ditylenchus destructor TaxID=166010 RepID=A0AAD4MFH0_9BILA|nr:AMP-binding enzyme domain-containing protein [Ditylenchus destructor]
MGVGKGDRVALAMRNLPEWPVVFFAAVSIGGFLVPLNAWWTSGELDYGLRGTRAAWCCSPMASATNRLADALTGAARPQAHRRQPRARSAGRGRAAAGGPDRQARRLGGTARRAAPPAKAPLGPTTMRRSSTPAAPPATPRARSARTATHHQYPVERLLRRASLSAPRRDATRSDAARRPHGDPAVLVTACSAA